MASVICLSFRTDEATAEGLERLVSATDRPRSRHSEQALKAYVTSQAWQIEDIRRGVAEADAGDFTPDEDIEAVCASFAEPLGGDISGRFATPSAPAPSWPISDSGNNTCAMLLASK